MDYWHPDYIGAPTDGTSWEAAGDTRYRVLRGCSWSNYVDGDCRSANRGWLTPSNRNDLTGFRVVSVARTP